jgi:mRNA interferase MazF
MIRFSIATNEARRGGNCWFPYVDGNQGKKRPALVVQNDRDNLRLANTIIAMISGNIRHAGEPTQVLVEPNHSAGASSDLRGRSVVKCCNLYTVRKQDIQRTIGHSSTGRIGAVNEALKAALGVV